MSHPRDLPVDARAARRRAALRHHPDRGGDPEVFVRVMRELTAAPARSAGPPAGTRAGRPVGVVVGPARRTWRRARRRGRTLARDLRGALPRPWPGSRRYGRL